MPAYMIFTRFRTRDAAEMETYSRMAGATFAGRSMKPVALYGRCEVVEGPGAETVAILEFSTFAEAKAWYDSPAYKEARVHRFRGADYGVMIVEGPAPAR